MRPTRAAAGNAQHRPLRQGFQTPGVQFPCRLFHLRPRRLIVPRRRSLLLGTLKLDGTSDGTSHGSTGAVASHDGGKKTEPLGGKNLRKEKASRQRLRDLTRIPPALPSRTVPTFEPYSFYDCDALERSPCITDPL